MKTIFKIILTAMIVIMVIIFSIQATAQTGLPKKWPADMTITIDYGGGMREYNESTFISAAGCYVYRNDEGKETRDTFSLSQEDLDSIIQYMRRKHFLQIHKGIVPNMIYDMGTTSFTLKWADHVNIITTGATMRLTGHYKQDYNDISYFIDSIIARKTKK